PSYSRCSLPAAALRAQCVLGRSIAAPRRGRAKPKAEHTWLQNENPGANCAPWSAVRSHERAAVKIVSSPLSAPPYGGSLLLWLGRWDNFPPQPQPIPLAHSLEQVKSSRAPIRTRSRAA